MKKLLYSITAIAALLFTSGCVREIGPDPIKGELVETEFIVNLDNAAATKADINNDAAFINKLVIAAFKKSNGEYLAALNEANGNFTIEAVATNNLGQKQFSVKAKLVRNFAYTIGFFAMNENAPYTLGTDGAITMAAGASNDESLDAFYAAADITLDPSDATTLSKSITLTRPLAQINVLSDPADWAAAETSGITSGLKSSISIAKAPNKISLLDGSVSGNATLAFTETAIPEGEINVAAANEIAKNAHYVAMAYILSSDSASPVDVTFTVPANGTDFTGFTRTVQNVPNKANYKTNLHGDLFTTQGDFTVVISEGFGGNDNQNINIPQPTVSPLSSIPDDITSANPGIQQPTITTGNNVTTNMANELFFGIDTNSDGAITYSSSDHNVGTIDNSGVFTPVGPGSTNITVTQAAGTQTKAIGDPLAEITIVYHVTVEATEYSVTVSGTTENGTVEIKNEAGDAEFTQGISGTKFTVVATPATNYNLGSLVVADTDGNLEASEGKYTIRTSNVTVTATFVAMGQVATPVISPDGGFYTAGEKATITCSEDGAAIYYTLDGTEPSTTSTLYEGPIDLTNCTIKAIAVKANMINSAVAEASFTAKLATEIVLADQNMTFGGEALNLTPVVKAGETIVSGAEFTYAAGNAKVSVTSAGVVSAVAAGESSVKINATVPDAYLAPAEKTVAINIAKAASSISWNDGALEVTVGGSTLDLSDKYTKDGSTGAVSFAIASGYDKAHLDGNTLVADAEGSVTINATLAADENYDGATTAIAKTVTVNAAAATTYGITINTNAGNGNTIGASKTTGILENEVITLTATVNDGYSFAGWTITETSSGDDITGALITASDNPVSFDMPNMDITVTATFDENNTDPYYIKVTSTDALEDGHYLIVCETAGVALADAVDEVSNTVSVTISDSKIASSNSINEHAFVFKKSSGSFLAPNGKYLTHTGSSNTLNTSDSEVGHNISFDGGNAVLSISGTSYNLKYNASSGQTRFRYFTTAQTSIQLYKYVGTWVDPDITAVISGVPDNMELVPGGSFNFGTGASINSGATLNYSINNNTDAELSGSTVTIKSTATVGNTVTVTISADAVSGYTKPADKTCVITVKAQNNNQPVTVSVNLSTYATDHSWASSSSSGQKTVTLDEVITATASSGSNTGKYYSDWRFYQTENATLTISSSNGYSLQEVTFTFTNSNNGKLSYGSTTVSSGSAVSVTGSSAVFEVGATSGTSGQIRFTAITVKYIED